MIDFFPIFRGHVLWMLALLTLLSEQCRVFVSFMFAVFAESVCFPGSHANVAVFVVLLMGFPSSVRLYWLFFLSDSMFCVTRSVLFILLDVGIPRFA